MEALEVFHACSSRIVLVITDIRMPRMTETDLAASLRSDCPAIPLIFVSGEPAPADTVDPKKGIFFIGKPFAPKSLLETASQFFKVVIYLTQVTARYCGCKRPDSRGGVGRQVTGSQRKRLGRCPRAPAIVAGSGGRPTSPGHAYQAPRAFQGLGGATSLASRLQPVVAT